MDKITIGGKQYPISCKMANQFRIYEKYPDILSEDKKYDPKKNLEVYMDIYIEVLNGQFATVEDLLNALSTDEYLESFATVLKVFWGTKEKKTPVTST